MNNFLHIRAPVDNQRSVGFVSLKPAASCPCALLTNCCSYQSAIERTSFQVETPWKAFTVKFARTTNINDAMVFVCVLAHI